MSIASTTSSINQLSKEIALLENAILPLWHDIMKDDVQAFSATLAGRKALNTDISTIDEIADEL